MNHPFAKRVKELGLPLDQVIVIGSGILDQLGVRKAADIDLAASSEILGRLATEKENWIEKTDKNQRQYFIRRDSSVEVWDGWEFDGKIIEYEDLLDQAVELDGVKFVSLDFLRQWKIWRGRDKDLQDVQLIDEWRRNNE